MRGPQLCSLKGSSRSVAVIRSFLGPSLTELGVSGGLCGTETAFLLMRLDGTGFSEFHLLPSGIQDVEVSEKWTSRRRSKGF